MSFELYDAVVVVGKTEAGAPYNGMRGFINDVFSDDYYMFSALSHENSPLNEMSIGEGGCEGIYLQPDDGEDLRDAINTILYKREAHYKEVMAKYHLKNIVEGNKDDE